MKKQLAQIGIISRGIIFTLMAVLTALTVYKGARGKISGTVEAFDYISTTLYGLVLLIALVLGMLIYVGWRFYLTWKVDSNESAWNKLRLKANHFGIALIYIFFIVYAVQLIFQLNSNGSNFFTQLLKRYGEDWWFELIVLLIGLGVIGKGIYQFYLAYSRKFLILVVDDIPAKAKKLYILFGIIGYIVRGIIYSCLGYLISRSSFQLYGNPSKSPAEAMSFLQFFLGNTFLLIMAGGLFIFSLFVYIKAKYRKIE